MHNLSGSSGERQITVVQRPLFLPEVKGENGSDEEVAHIIYREGCRAEEHEMHGISSESRLYLEKNKMLLIGAT